ncbi:MAG: CHAP domain-containing protein [Ruminococcaceae bacterium]|nr:CHAP domain-containing protein [Oscillospiraceae bacterium]
MQWTIKYLKKCGKGGIIKMNKKQYNNVIEYTMKHEQSAQTDDSLSTARAIFDNMGVALPQGDIKAVYETIKTDDYMGWKSCTMQEAQAAADKGMAAIGISEDRIVVLSATDEEQPVTQTASVMTLSENTSAFAVDGLQYYSYSYVTTHPNTPDPMQVKINNLVEWALGAEGKKLHECSEYFGVSNPHYGWCAWFVRLCGEKAGLNFGSSDSPTALSGVYGNVDFSSTNKPKVGDLAFIITHGESSIGHIGIVISIGNGQITTMEGNMSGSTDTSTVKKAYYSYETGVGDGYGRIARIGKNS